MEEKKVLSQADIDALLLGSPEEEVDLVTAVQELTETAASGGAGGDSVGDGDGEGDGDGAGGVIPDEVNPEQETAVPGEDEGGSAFPAEETAYAPEAEPAPVAVNAGEIQAVQEAAAAAGAAATEARDQIAALFARVARLEGALERVDDLDTAVGKLATAVNGGQPDKALRA